MKWLLVTWYIAGGYPWTSYEFESKATCVAAQQLFKKSADEGFKYDYRWYCVPK